MGRQRCFKRWGWSCFSWVGKSHLGFSAEEVQKHGGFLFQLPSPHPWRVLILTSFSRSSASFHSGLLNLCHFLPVAVFHWAVVCSRAHLSMAQLGKNIWEPVVEPRLPSCFLSTPRTKNPLCSFTFTRPPVFLAYRLFWHYSFYYR